jgi:hypothetical protein
MLNDDVLHVISSTQIRNAHLGREWLENPPFRMPT